MLQRSKSDTNNKYWGHTERVNCNCLLFNNESSILLSGIVDQNNLFQDNIRIFDIHNGQLITDYISKYSLINIVKLLNLQSEYYIY